MNTVFRKFIIAITVSLGFSISAGASDVDRVFETTTHATTDYSLQIRISDQAYKIPGATDQERVNFESLSEADRNSFLQSRIQFLEATAKALQTMKYGFGIGSVTKDRVKYTLTAIRDRRILQSVKQLDPGVQEDVMAAYNRELEKRVQEEEINAKKTLSERAQQVIESTLAALDKKLWSQAELFSHSNEYGVMLTLGLQALGGIQNKGGWGGLFDIGISLGYNRDTKALAFQIFRDFERFESTPMKAAFVAGAMGKVGFYIANKKDKQLQYHGRSFYPPVVPGFTTSTPQIFASGFSSGLTWPPSPLGDLMTYTNKVDQKVLLRITISPHILGFIRFETGIKLSSLKFVLEPVNLAIRSIRDMFVPERACSIVF